MVDEVTEVEGGDGEPAVRSTEQLHMLQRLCLPQMVSLLHTVLHATGSYKQCVELANLVASEDYKLYQVSLFLIRASG